MTRGKPAAVCSLIASHAYKQPVSPSLLFHYHYHPPSSATLRPLRLFLPLLARLGPTTMTIVDPAISQTAASAVLPALPPAKAVPDNLSASVKHWWATGTKESAIAEERLLR
jgi:hypothetical protein